MIPCKGKGEVLHGEGNATLFLVHGENDASDLYRPLTISRRVTWTFLSSVMPSETWNEPVHAVPIRRMRRPLNRIPPTLCARGEVRLLMFSHGSAASRFHVRENVPPGYFFDLEHHGLDS